MQDPRQDVGVTGRHGFEEAARDEVDPVAERRIVPDGLRQIEVDAAQLRVSLQQCPKEGAVSAADVDHELVVVPVERRQAVSGAVLAAGHRAVEGGTLAGLRLEPGPEVGSERPREGLGSRRGIKCRNRVVEDRAEQVRERAGGVAEQAFGGFVVAEDPGFLLGEHTVARECTQDAVDGVAIGTRRLRELAHGARSRRELACQAEIGRDGERLRRHHAAHEIPELRHERAAWTAPATSSTSDSVSVRQSSKSLPSRRIPTTGGSCARNSSANVSSTAHA